MWGQTAALPGAPQASLAEPTTHSWRPKPQEAQKVPSRWLCPLGRNRAGRVCSCPSTSAALPAHLLSPCQVPPAGRAPRVRDIWLPWRWVNAGPGWRGPKKPALWGPPGPAAQRLGWQGSGVPRPSSFQPDPNSLPRFPSGTSDVPGASPIDSAPNPLPVWSAKGPHASFLTPLGTALLALPPEPWPAPSHPETFLL